MTTTTVEAGIGTPTASSAFTSLLLRDLVVVRKQPMPFLMRTVTQPLLTVFVFAYVFPKIGQTIGGHNSDFATNLAPGLLGMSIIFQGIQAVALPLVQEFGYTREIEDRVMAPLSVSMVGMSKIVSGALQAALSALITVPILLWVPASPVHLRVHWLALITIAPLAALLSGSLGLALGTKVQPRQVPLMFSILVLPMSMLGCVYYPWSSLHTIKWLQYAILINPLVYMSEGFRMAVTNLNHMAPWAIYTMLIVATGLLMRAGLKGFANRVLT
ncbi:MAG TPA: ABC transporter permease [Acidimicrobiia bacterium]